MLLKGPLGFCSRGSPHYATRLRAGASDSAYVSPPALVSRMINYLRLSVARRSPPACARSTIATVINTIRFACTPFEVSSSFTYYRAEWGGAEENVRADASTLLGDISSRAVRRKRGRLMMMAVEIGSIYLPLPDCPPGATAIFSSPP